MPTVNEIGTGRDQIAIAFYNAQAKQTAALMPYFTLGYPDRQTSLDIIEAMAPYSDLIELGVPFSDPLADGPTIQNSTQVSLENGTTTADCLAMIQELRQRGITTPFLLMGYYNPILAYGQEAYVQVAAEMGANGFIIPDLPSEEADELEQLATNAGLAYIHMLAPTSNAERIRQVTARAKGFIYMVSITGVTGTGSSTQSDLSAFIARVRSQAQVPLAVGFGIKTPQHAADVGQLADGVIVGTAVIQASRVDENKPQAVAQFVRSLKEALIEE